MKGKKSLIGLCKMSVASLQKKLYKELQNHGYKGIEACDNYIYAKGDIPVMVVAHIDTVYKETPKKIIVRHGDVISSPQGIGGDDRCGVFIILSLLESGYRPHVLFTNYEETGCIGATKFATSHQKNMPNVNYILEFDRRGQNDLVRYSDENDELITDISNITGMKEAIGSFSDIVELSETFQISSVNLSSGYYNEHKKEQEYIVFSEVISTIERAKVIIDTLDKKYEYISTPQYGYGYYGYGDYGYGDYGYGDYRNDWSLNKQLKEYRSIDIDDESSHYVIGIGYSAEFYYYKDRNVIEISAYSKEIDIEEFDDFRDYLISKGVLV